MIRGVFGVTAPPPGALTAAIIDSASTPPATILASAPCTPLPGAAPDLVAIPAAGGGVAINGSGFLPSITLTLARISPAGTVVQSATVTTGAATSPMAGMFRGTLAPVGASSDVYTITAGVTGSVALQGATTVVAS
ncbi:MAG: hypothetical protein ACYDAR_11700 [Thermomicrobiales bacterium]